LLDALMAPTEDRAALIGRLHADPDTQNFAGFPTDLEEDRQLALDLAQALKDAKSARQE
jgi:hypothetical protein